MSSTNRGYERHISDFYITPEKPINDFINVFANLEDIFTDYLSVLESVDLH